MKNKLTLVIVFIYLFSVLLVFFLNCSSDDSSNSIISLPITTTSQENKSWYFNDIYVQNISTAYAIGINDGTKKGIAYIYSSGTWTLDTSITASENEYGFTGIDFCGTNGYICGYKLSSTSSNYSALMLKNPSNYWYDISDQLLSSSSLTDWQLNAVDFLTPSFGFAGGFRFGNDNGIILKFDGSSWTNSPTDNSASTLIQAISICTTNFGYAVGYQYSSDYQSAGKIFKLNNGYWIDQVITMPSTYSELYDISMFDTTIGIAVGYDFTNKKAILFEFNGSSWNQNEIINTTFGNNIKLNGCYIVDENHIYLVGSKYDSTSEKYIGKAFFFNNTSWVELTLPTVSDNWELKKINVEGATYKGFMVGKDSKNGSKNATGVILEVNNTTITSVTLN